MELSPIVLFVYNRPYHTKQTLMALSHNDFANGSILFIYSDGPIEGATEGDLNNIREVRKIIREQNWCKEVKIIESDKNKGLAASIINGVTRVVNEYGKGIVLEDDIVTSKGFLEFMNNALNLYENDDKVMHITGHTYLNNYHRATTYFLRYASSWGWATWKRAWQFYDDDAIRLFKSLHNASFFTNEDYNSGFGNSYYHQLKVNTEGKYRTWAVKWHTTIYLKRGYCLFPANSLVTNIGFDGSGTHMNNIENDRNKNANIIADHIDIKSVPVKIDDFALKLLKNYYKKNYLRKNYLKKALNKVKIILKKLAN